MNRTIIMLVAAMVVTNANAQQSTHYKTWPEALRQVEQSGTIPPGWATIGPQPLVVMPPNLKPELVVMNGGMGGHIAEHMWRFRQLRGATVEMRGPCWSACTLITGYIPKDKLCFSTGSFLAFHSAQTADHRPSINDTWMMYWAVPAEIRSWLDDRGGPNEMTVNTYWFLRDAELWKMGYPRCK